MFEDVLNYILIFNECYVNSRLFFTKMTRYEDDQAAQTYQAARILGTLDPTMLEC
jgi:hypothetical protein